MLCEFEPFQDRYKCPVCGVEKKRLTRRVCRERNTGAKLGDFTERMLQKAGVTENRYKSVKEKFGLPPTCNCPARKKWLNDVGEYLKSLVG